MEEKRKWIRSIVGEDIESQYDDDGIKHVYRAMTDYGMSVYDADKWAWLNTLFGYDIGADRAISIINWLDENGQNAMEFSADDKGTLQNICELELGLHLDFRAWPDETPDVIRYVWPAFIEDEHHE